MGLTRFEMHQKFLETLAKWLESELIVDFSHEEVGNLSSLSGAHSGVKLSVSVTVENEAAPKLWIREEVHRAAEKLAAESSLRVESAAVTHDILHGCIVLIAADSNAAAGYFIANIAVVD